jgi:hypothetical protein
MIGCSVGKLIAEPKELIEARVKKVAWGRTKHESN